MYSKYLFLIDISKDSGPLQVSYHLISILIVFIANYQITMVDTLSLQV